MSHSIATYEPTKAEMFDWSYDDLINNAPYEVEDMIYALYYGQFIVEGKPSDVDTAFWYVEEEGSEEAWKTWEQMHESRLVLYPY